MNKAKLKKNHIKTRLSIKTPWSTKCFEGQACSFITVYFIADNSLSRVDTKCSVIHDSPQSRDETRMFVDVVRVHTSSSIIVLIFLVSIYFR